MTISTTFLGLGTMGSAIATAALDAGRPTVAWTRTPHRAQDLGERGATVADSVKEAVAGDGVIVACLFDHQSVHHVLDHVATGLSGRTVINLTTNDAEPVARARHVGRRARYHLPRRRDHGRPGDDRRRVGAGSPAGGRRAPR